MLNPLAEVGIRVLMPIRVGSSQLMVHVLRNGEGSDGQQQKDESDTQTAFQILG